jgi:hypothetical protein
MVCVIFFATLDSLACMVGHKLWSIGLIQIVMYMTGAAYFDFDPPADCTISPDFESSADVLATRESILTKLLTRVCPICQLTISSRNFARHQKIHEKTPPPCLRCGKSYQRTQDLRRYMHFSQGRRRRAPPLQTEGTETGISENRVELPARGLSEHPHPHPQSKNDHGLNFAPPIRNDGSMDEAPAWGLSGKPFAPYPPQHRSYFGPDFPPQSSKDGLTYEEDESFKDSLCKWCSDQHVLRTLPTTCPSLSFSSYTASSADSSKI